MTPDRRIEGLAAAARIDRPTLIALAEPIARRDDIQIVVSPEPSTVMTVLGTPVGEQCFAEVVVTTAQVVVAGTDGWGCVLGWDAEAALAAALIDAADPSAGDALAAEALQTESAQRAQRNAQVRRTRMEVA